MTIEISDLQRMARTDAAAWQAAKPLARRGRSADKAETPGLGAAAPAADAARIAAAHIDGGAAEVPDDPYGG
ncbi:MAG: hypothetical protein AAF192_16435 [Pseudomonadota bacterium]